MAKIKGNSYGCDMENPPARLVSHKIPQHILPPEQMSDGVNDRDPREMDQPPKRFQKTDPPRKIPVLQGFPLLQTLPDQSNLPSAG
jgi:hypothetical protein